MVNQNYLNTLKWLTENNISMTQDQLNDLKVRIENAEMNDVVTISYDEAFDFLADINEELDNYSESADILFESANSDISARFKKLKKEFAEENKAYKKNIKAQQFVAASKNLDDMNTTLATAEKDIRSIDASSVGSKVGGFFRTFGLQLIAIAITGFVFGGTKALNKGGFAAQKASAAAYGKGLSKAGKALGKASQGAYDATNKLHSIDTGKAVAHAANKAGFAAQQASAGAYAKGLKKVGKGLGKASQAAYDASNNVAGSGNAIAKDTATYLSAVTIGTGLATAFDSFKQMANDKKAAETEQDKANAGNIYREKVLTLIASMRKEISMKKRQVEKLSKKVDNEMIDDEEDE